MKRRQEDAEVSKRKFVRKLETSCSALSSHVTVEGKAWGSVILSHISPLSVRYLPSRQSCIYVGSPGTTLQRVVYLSHWQPLACSGLITYLEPFWSLGEFVILELSQAYTPAGRLFQKQEWLLPLTSVSGNQICRKV